MAKRDFDDYLLSVQSQVISLKSDLRDFEDGLKTGHVTEEQLAALKEEYQRIDDNYQRLLYVGYLLALPKQPWKKRAFKKKTADLEKYLTLKGTTKECILKENEATIQLIEQEIEKLTESDE